MNRSMRFVGCLIFAVFAIAMPLAAQSERVGAWNLTTDPMTDLVNHFRGEARRAQASITVEAAAFDISSEEREPESDDAKRDLLRSWQLAVVEALEVYDLLRLDRDRLTVAQRRVHDNMRAQMIENMPFGMRARARSQYGDVFILMDDSEASCTEENGAYGGLVMSVYPEANVASDYGTVAVMIFGLDACGRVGGYAERRLTRLMEAARSEIRRTLRRSEG